MTAESGGSGLTIVGLGEALFDCFPDRQVLGGAPLNAAFQAHQLATREGGRGVVAIALGTDPLGKQMQQELEQRGLDQEFVQVDPVHPTGRVDVRLIGREPIYEFNTDTAWDHLQFTPDWKRLAGTCSAVVFGTLAQRSPVSRATIGQFLQAAPQALKLFDCNLRLKFYSADILRAGCQMANVIKLNELELPIVSQLVAGTALGCSADECVSALRSSFTQVSVVLTRGELGTVLYSAAGKSEGKPAAYPAAPQADAVGAGDACTAGILWGLLHQWSPEKTVQLANKMGAWVASQRGATPQLPPDILAFATSE